MSPPEITKAEQMLSSGRSKIPAALILVLLVVYSVIRSVIAAASKPLWFDEICTQIIARLGNARAIWDALKNAADGQPPLFYLIEAHASTLLRNEEISYRLISIFGLACVLIFVFLFACRRTNAAYALLCSALLLVTILFDIYAVEARPYSLEVACFALALLCYQRAPAPAWMIVMGLALALAENLHYYAIFALVPFGAAEAAMLAKTRQIRFAVWLAIISGCVPILWLFPLLRALKITYGEHLLAPASLVRAFAIYGWIFTPQKNVLVVFALATACATAILIAIAAAIQSLLRPSRTRAARTSDPFAHEHVLMLGFLALPFIAYLGAKLAHGALVDRYVLSVVLGIPLAACSLHAWLGRRGRIAFTIAAILLIASREARFWMQQDHHIGQLQSPAPRAEQMVEAAGYSNLPVVISSPLQYLQLNHYAPPELQPRLVFLVDPPKAIEYDGSDSGDRQMLLLRAYAPLAVEKFADFRAKHLEFLLLSNGDPRLDWWPARFRAEGHAELQVLESQNPWKLYRVQLKNQRQDAIAPP